MTEKYVQLMEDLQYSKREAQNWKQKHTILEEQLNSAHQQNQQLKKTVNRLQETNSRLAEVNRQLNVQKQSIFTYCSEQVNAIKQQIAKKQQQIQTLKQSSSPTIINHQLAIKQLRFQLAESYQKQSALQGKKIQELTALVEKHNYEKEIEREKAALKIKVLQNSIRDMQMKHQQEITQYSAKIFQATQVRPPQQRELLRRSKRQNEQLKKRLDLATSDLESVLEQKNQVHKDYSKWMKEHQKIISNHQNQILTYKAQIARLTALTEENSIRRDDMIVRDKDRDIKRLKNEAEDLRDLIISKEQKISQMEVEKAKLQAEIKTIRSEQQRQLQRVQEATQWQRDRLQKEIIEARQTLEKLKGQNLQLNDRIYESTKATSQHRKQFDNLKKEGQQQRNQLKRQLSQHNMPTIKQQKPAQLPPQPANQNDQEIKQLQEAFRNEKGKLRQFLAKYIELKKKYDSIQRKLKKANHKIMELLQTKIILGSPKANAQKHFEFPTEPRTGVKISPPHRNEVHKQGESRNLVLNSLKEDGLTNTANFRPNRLDVNSKTNPAGFYPKNYMMSPPNRNIHIQDQQANQSSYYQKSFKLKNQQLKELKCTNHEHS